MRNFQRNAQHGFTLIELMIVVAIIGILVVVALPAYQDYSQRAQVSEAFTMTEGMKTAISEFAQTNGAYPAEADIAAGVGAPATGKYAGAATTAATGVITVMMNSTSSGVDVRSKVITFTPPTLAGLTGAFSWTCASTDTTTGMKQKFLPNTCAGV